MRATMTPTNFRWAIGSWAPLAICLVAWTAVPQGLAADEAPAPMSASEVIEVLDETVDWYRTLAVQQKIASEPSDLLILYGNRETANQVMALAFGAARLNADLLAKQTSAPAAPNAGVAGCAAGISGHIEKQDYESQAGETPQDHTPPPQARTPDKSLADLRAKMSELQGELDLLSAKKSALGEMSAFLQNATGSGTAGNSLKAQIEAMAVAMSATDGSGTAAPNAPSLNLAPTATEVAGQVGLWGIGEGLFKLSEKMATIATVDQRTRALQSTVNKFRAPIIAHVKALSARGDSFAAAAYSASGAGLIAVRAQLDALASDFKQTSQLLIPLSKENLLLDQYRRNLADWRKAVRSQIRTALRALGWHLVLLALVLSAVFLLAEIWRRAVLRYSRDSRRRHQLLLIQRIVLWVLVFLIITFSFANELGSVFTFAGLITAGLAVAMQSVLVSIVGYFFLIGKYGIKAGDRVQIGEVSGEVFEVGLVRLYLMELDGHGTFGPTGRVVAFPNSIVFTMSGGMFKHIPGVSVAWHEITLALPAGADYAALKDRLQLAAADALAEHREELLRQTGEIQKTTQSASAGAIQAQVQLRFSSAGVEACVRYPVVGKDAAQIDESVSQKLSHAIA